MKRNIRRDAVFFAAKVVLLRPDKAQEILTALNHSAQMARNAAVQEEHRENWKRWALFHLSADRSENRYMFLKHAMRHMK